MEADGEQEDRREGAGPDQAPDEATGQDSEAGPRGSAEGEADSGDQPERQDGPEARPDSTERRRRTKRDEPPPQGATPEEAQRAVHQAREQLKMLQGKEAESVSSLERTRDGWTIALEVVEVQR